MWNRDCLWDHKQKPKCDEIPMRERDELWKRNSFGDDDEIPMWNRDKYGNAMRIAFMAQFQWETDQYSTKLNIQSPSIESRFWKEKIVVPNNYLCWQEQKLCDVIII